MKNIAIIGAGPAGCTTGIILAQAGYRVAIFAGGSRPPLIVGESLLPAVIPMLKRLGVEERVRDFSVFKPGATFCLGNQENLDFAFGLARSIHNYAYNVPRNTFDHCLVERAEEAGATIIRAKAQVELSGDPNRPLALTEESLSLTGKTFDGAVDLLVDATGRTRLFPGLLELSSTEGHRRDLALFSHRENVQLVSQGNIHVDRYTKGWGWRIPLPGKVSVGIVVDPKHLEGLGKTREEQYEGFLATEPELKHAVKDSTRVSPVMSYTNYQWKSDKLYGPGWALSGDSAGFIDPVFSTGLFLAMYSAEKLANALLKNSDTAMARYAVGQRNELDAWQSIIDTWYDGRLFTLFRLGQRHKTNLFGKIVNPHITKHVTRIFTGEIRSGSYSHKLLNFVTQRAVDQASSAELAIR
jgi:flavin-dependent dehydrogenase